MSAQLRRRLIGGVLGAALFLGAAGCSTTQEPWRTVTTEDSQLLAIARFQNFDLRSRAFRTAVTVNGQKLELAGLIDFRVSSGFATVTGQGFAPQWLLWGEAAVALAPTTNLGGGTPTSDEALAAAWNARPIDPRSSALDALLLALLHLGADRPDNPLLIQQSGALWLGETDVDGVAMQLFAGPNSSEPLGPTDPAPDPELATVRYAVDDDGVMHRVELKLSEWVIVELDSPEGAQPDIDALQEVLTQ